MLGLLDKIVFSSGVFMLVIGLLFEASGFGVFIAGQSGGFILVVLGISMFWAGWIASGARSFSCAVAAALNMLDASTTLALWNFEVNPAVIFLGPNLFLISKIASSMAIVLYARFYREPKKGGIILSVLFAGIVGWNLSQHVLANLGLSNIVVGLLFGTLLGFIASSVVVLMLLASDKTGLKSGER